MNLVMELPYTQVILECHDGIRIPYMEKIFWCVYSGIDLCELVCDWKKGMGEGPYVKSI